MSQIEPSTLQSAMQAQNLPVDSGHFSIEINILDDDGDSVKRLSEFGSTIVNWSFESAPPPETADPDEDLHFDEPEEAAPRVGHAGKVQRPFQSPVVKDPVDEEEAEIEDEEEDDEDDEEGIDYSGDYRELVLTHQVTGAAFHELNKHVFDHERRPEVSVKIEYYVEVPKVGSKIKDGEYLDFDKHPVFTHMFYGIFYVPEDVSGNRAIGGQKQGPLLLVTKMEVLGSRLYGDPADTDMLARILQEYAGHEAH